MGRIYWNRGIMTRTDIHRPSAIVPDEYEYVGQEYIPVHGIGDCYALQAMRERIREHMARTGGSYSPHSHGGNCMVCGSVNAIYTVLFYHRPSNTYVRMGQDCATKCDMGGDFKNSAFRAAVDDARKAHAGKAKAQAILSDKGLSAAWDIFAATDTAQFKYEEATIRNIVGKLVQYGSASEKQFEFIGKLLAQIPNRNAVAAQRQAEADAAAPCPSGRMVIEGTVLTVKVDDGGYYGPTTKILVKHDSGWKVWGTRPSGTNAERGDKVRFTATVKVSDKDPKFGYYSRPLKAEVLQRAAEEVSK